MKGLVTILLLAICTAVPCKAQQYTYTDQDEWDCYDAFNDVFLDRSKHIYRDYSDTPKAVDRWNGAAAIWCQAIYFDMAINAYNRAVAEGNDALISKYKLQAKRIFDGEKNQYVSFNFDDCNTNTGWFVYDDIMWWTIALGRAYEAFGTSSYLTLSERSFLRVWYGSSKVGDDGSYADPTRGLGGGMFWEWQPIDKPAAHKAGDFRSACINFPTVIAACTLYNNIASGRTEPTGSRPTKQTREWYLEKAKEVYDWATKTLVSNGRVADGIHGGGPEWNDHLYNQATFIGASCMLYQITGESDYLTKAVQGANYVFTTMCKSSILPLETGVEQGIYCAIFAQYMHKLIYELGKSQFLPHIKRNIQKGWTNRDKTRGISDGKFTAVTPEGSRIESYSGSALPALMLMFPMGDSSTDVESIDDKAEAAINNVYTTNGQLVLKDANHDEVNNLDSGIYISGRKKLLVK